MFNSNMWPNVAPLQDACVQNMSDLEFDLSLSLKVKSNDAAGLPIYDFLLVLNSNDMSISHHLEVITTLKKTILPLVAKFRPTHTHPPLPRADFSQNRIITINPWRGLINQQSSKMLYKKIIHLTYK